MLNAGTLAINNAGFGTTARTVALNGGGTLNNGGNAVTFSGVISGNGGLTAAGAGTTTLERDEQVHGRHDDHGRARLSVGSDSEPRGRGGRATC